MLQFAAISCKQLQQTARYLDSPRGFLEPFSRRWHKWSVDDDRMLAALRSREPEAMSHLVDAVGDRLLRSAFLLCGHDADAQDLVQQTFLEALRTVHRFRRQSSIYTWLHGILLNLTRHYHRDRKRIVYGEPVCEETSGSSEDSILPTDREFTCSALQQALLRLSEPHREIIVLRFYEHMKIHEIAAQLGIAGGTVKSRLHYALQEMERLLPRELNVFRGQGTEIGTR